MKLILALTCLLLFTFSLSQTNLICNGSFEVLNEVSKIGYMNSTNLSSGNFDPNNNHGLLFEHWSSRLINGDIVTISNLNGLSYGIIPGYYNSANADGVSSGLNPNDPFAILSNISDPISFKGDEDLSHLKLTPLTGTVVGFDLSPPNTKFGENIYAQEGTNYVALFDFKNTKYSAGPNLLAQLKQNTVKNVIYDFSIRAIKMNLLNQIRNNESWGSVRVGKIEVWLSDDIDHPKGQKILSENISTDSWNEYTNLEFISNKNHKYIYLEYNPLAAFGSSYQRRISGVFIDNLKLYESCETPINQCQNANYRRDLLDVKLDKISIDDPLSLPIPTTNDTYGSLKTIRVIGLQNASRVKISIYQQGSSSAIREEDIYYPQSTWIWDGNYTNGTPAPDGDYTAKILLVSNECFSLPTGNDFNVDQKNFKLKRNYTVFNVWTETNLLVDQNILIHGLANITNLKIELLNLAGQQVAEFNLLNPPSTISISTNNILQEVPIFIAQGSYILRLTASNNCKSTVLSDRLIGVNVATSNSIPGFFNWSPVIKPATFPCPFVFNYNQNYLPPMNCCEGELFLENVEIWNSWDVNILGNIYIGPNVVFEPGVVNNLYSGQQIVVTPAGTGVIIQDETLLMPNTYNCVACIIQSIEIEETEDNSFKDSIARIIDTNSTILSETKVYSVYPNPVSGQFSVAIHVPLSLKLSNIQNVKLFDNVGRQVELTIQEKNEMELLLKSKTILDTGIYFLKFDTDEGPQGFSIIVQ